MRASLRAEVQAFLLAQGSSTVSVIRMGVRARRQDVDAVLAQDGFCEVPPPEGGSHRASWFSLSRLVPEARKGTLGRADLMLGALKGGRWRSREEIFRASGRFFLTNNAASQLRSRGFVVEQRRNGSFYEYRLVLSPASAEAAA